MRLRQQPSHVCFFPQAQIPYLSRRTHARHRGCLFDAVLVIGATQVVVVLRAKTEHRRPRTARFLGLSWTWTDVSKILFFIVRARRREVPRYPFWAARSVNPTSQPLSSCKPAPHPVSIHSERPPPILPCCRPTALRLSVNVNLYPYGAFVPGFCFFAYRPARWLLPPLLAGQVFVAYPSVPCVP